MAKRKTFTLEQYVKLGLDGDEVVMADLALIKLLRVARVTGTKTALAELLRILRTYTMMALKTVEGEHPLADYTEVGYMGDDKDDINHKA